MQFSTIPMELTAGPAEPVGSFPPTSIFRKRNFIRFQASLHRDGNLEIYITMIRLAVFGRFPSTSQILK